MNDDFDDDDDMAPNDAPTTYRVPVLVDPPMPGESLEGKHAQWFINQLSAGQAPHQIAATIGRPLADVMELLAKHGEELEQALTAALRVQTLQRATMMAAIADGPANPLYTGDGSVRRDKLRLDHNEKQLAILTKLAPKTKIEVTHHISIADNLRKARERLSNRDNDIVDAVIVSPRELDFDTDL